MQCFLWGCLRSVRSQTLGVMRLKLHRKALLPSCGERQTNSAGAMRWPSVHEWSESSHVSQSWHPHLTKPLRGLSPWRTAPQSPSPFSDALECASHVGITDLQETAPEVYFNATGKVRRAGAQSRQRMEECPCIPVSEKTGVNVDQRTVSLPLYPGVDQTAFDPVSL